MNIEQLFATLRGGCQIPGCTHQHDGKPLVLHARCHRTAGTFVYADATARTLTVKCARCGLLVVELEFPRATELDS